MHAPIESDVAFVQSRLGMPGIRSSKRPHLVIDCGVDGNAGLFGHGLAEPARNRERPRFRPTISGGRPWQLYRFSIRMYSLFNLLVEVDERSLQAERAPEARAYRAGTVLNRCAQCRALD